MAFAVPLLLWWLLGVAFGRLHEGWTGGQEFAGLEFTIQVSVPTDSHESGFVTDPDVQCTGF